MLGNIVDYFACAYMAFLVFLGLAIVYFLMMANDASWEYEQQRMAERRQNLRSDNGFTLIGFMLVMLLIAIVVTITLPLFGIK